jgi:hypothetical protein
MTEQDTATRPARRLFEYFAEVVMSHGRHRGSHLVIVV